MQRSFLFLAFFLAFVPVLLSANEQSDKVLQQISFVNDTWQRTHKAEVRAFWDHAAYHTGNMEAYHLTGNPAWYAYSDTWCRFNEWQGAKSTDKQQWRYQDYGEDQSHVLFGDWQVCFQTYLDMNNYVPAPYKIARAVEVMDYECNMVQTDFWWWADALYMVMPVFTKLFRLTGDIRYLDKLTANFLWTDSLLFDQGDHLYYRDAKYIYPKVKTACDGGKSFWARGDGWVLAGLAKVLADMPQDYPHRAIFVQRFQQLAEAVVACQQEAGYWSRSMLCEADAPGYETSGTAFFTYGLLWGINHGYLSRETFEPAALRGWNYLSTIALQADGTIGYVQPIGEKPDPTRTVDARSQAPFGTGAWLLAACEMVRYLTNSVPADAQQLTFSSYGSLPRKYAKDAAQPLQITKSSPSSRVGMVKNFKALVTTSPAVRNFVILDTDNNEIPYQITYDGNLLVATDGRDAEEIHLAVYPGVPQPYELTCNGRIYPDRMDDLAWENDRCAWRFYGPVAHRSMHNAAYGFDTFTKNTPHPIQDQLYHNELRSYGIHTQMQRAGVGKKWDIIHRSYTYHRNHGNGMDAYTVGSTLGAGAPALMSGDSLIYPLYYEKAEILDNGPLRFTVRMTMPSRILAGDTITEVRLISQERGSHYARCEVTYEGLTHKMPVCAGIVVHDSHPDAYILNKKKGYVLYADRLDHPDTMNGELYLGCYFPNGIRKAIYQPLKESVAGAVGHVLGITTYTPGTPFVYYFGNAWSEYDVPSLSIWESHIPNL